MLRIHRPSLLLVFSSLVVFFTTKRSRAQTDKSNLP
jgi:hypothetical protein